MINIPNKPAEFYLNNLYFGGKVVMETLNELLVEMPCEIFIRIPKANKISIQEDNLDKKS